MLSRSRVMGWPVRRAVAGPLAALAMLAALALAPPARADDDDRKIRSLTADLPARGIARIELKLAIGSVRIEPSPDDQVHVDLTSGRAIVEVRNLHMKDYFDIENALS